MTWHIVGGQIDDYLDGGVDGPVAASIEAHIVTCSDCRDRLAQRTPAQELAASWEGVERRIDADPVGGPARLLRRLGVSERHVRLLAPTVPLRLAWLASVALALGTAALLARGAPGGASVRVLVYLTVAAIVPLAAVAAALSAASEPAAEVAVAAPLEAVHVMGLRASVALAATVAVALTTGVLATGPWTEAALWLLPSLAMCSLTTALSGRIDPVLAATTVGVAWVCSVSLWVATTHDRLAPFRTAPQLAYLALTAIAITLVLRRPDLMEPARAVQARRTPRRTS